MSVVVNVMFSLMSVMSPPPTLRNLSVCEVVLVPYVDAMVAAAVMRVLLFCVGCEYAMRV